VTDANVPYSRGAGSVSTSLLLRVQTCDPAAWERLVSLYSPLVYRWCRQRGLQSADAADIGQEVFRAVARKIADFRRERPGDTFRGWLRTITRNKIRDHLRRQQPGATGVGGSEAQRQLLQLPSEDGEADDPAAEASEAALVYRRALKLLRQEFEERTWQAFWRVAVGDLAPAEVAAELGMTVNAVYLAKSRILRRLREEFADLLEEELG
jgi:RNA polymerase sigma-70 factor (ECF subfamily)